MNRYVVFTRWGRVGESGSNDHKHTTDIEEAKKIFSKKFQDKTKNKWDSRDNFKPSHGKYTLLEMDDEDGDEEVSIIMHYCYFYLRMMQIVPSTILFDSL